MLRTVPANRVTTEDLAQLPGDLSIGRSFRIVRMYSTILFKKSRSVTYSAAAFPDKDETYRWNDPWIQMRYVAP